MPIPSFTLFSTSRPRAQAPAISRNSSTHTRELPIPRSLNQPRNSRSITVQVDGAQLQEITNGKTYLNPRRSPTSSLPSPRNSTSRSHDLAQPLSSLPPPPRRRRRPLPPDVSDCWRARRPLVAEYGTCWSPDLEASPHPRLPSSRRPAAV